MASLCLLHYEHQIVRQSVTTLIGYQQMGIKILIIGLWIYTYVIFDLRQHNGSIGALRKLQMTTQ